MSHATRQAGLSSFFRRFGSQSFIDAVTLAESEHEQNLFALAAMDSPASFRRFFDLGLCIGEVTDRLRLVTTHLPTYRSDMEAATLNCPMCGAAASSEATRCEHCGARLATVACPSCFGMIFVGSKFCPHCGAAAQRVEGAAT